MSYLLATITVAIAWAWVVGHQLVIGWMGAVLIEQMPEPDHTSGKLYRYFYGVVQFIGANLKRMKGSFLMAVPPAVPPTTPLPEVKPTA
jgi:hypothetical protein